LPAALKVINLQCSPPKRTSSAPCTARPIYAEARIAAMAARAVEAAAGALADGDFPASAGAALPQLSLPLHAASDVRKDSRGDGRIEHSGAGVGAGGGGGGRNSGGSFSQQQPHIAISAPLTSRSLPSRSPVDVGKGHGGGGRQQGSKGGCVGGKFRGSGRYSGNVISRDATDDKWREGNGRGTERVGWRMADVSLSLEYSILRAPSLPSFMPSR